MRIGKNNYELFLVDYSEGKLSEETANEVVQFLAANPNINDEFELFKNSENETSEIILSNKENLKNIPYETSSANSEFFQQLCVAKLEQQLSPDEEQRFNTAVLAEKEKQKEFNLFAKTKFISENTIYNEKLTLKQSFTSHVINPNNFIEYCIACSEGWLNYQGATALNKYIAKNKKLKKEYDLVSQIKFAPDYSIVFPNKANLKKFQFLGAQTRKYISSAASIAAVLALSLFVYRTPSILNNIQTATIIDVDASSNTGQIRTTKQISKNIKEDAISFKNDSQQTRKIKKESFFSNNAFENERTPHVESLKPKTINNIKCKKCTINKKIIKASSSAILNKKIASVEQKATKEKINSKSLASNIVKAGISGVNKITNGKVKVKKVKGTQKTKLTFSSKHLAFSTNVK